MRIHHLFWQLSPGELCNGRRQSAVEVHARFRGDMLSGAFAGSDEYLAATVGSDRIGAIVAVYIADDGLAEIQENRGSLWLVGMTGYAVLRRRHLAFYGRPATDETD